jgi:hypothetical protein
MATKEKVIDLKPKAEKITEEQLKELQALIKTINSLQFEVGKIEAQKHELVHRLSNSQSQVIVLQNKFEEEYGTCNIDVNDGTIHREEDDK